MDFLFELAALAPDDGLALEESLELNEEPMFGLMLLSVLAHVLGLLGYFAFPLVCLRLTRELAAQWPGWKKAAASAAAGIILGVACQAAVGLPLYFWSVHGQPLYLEDNALVSFWAGQMAVRYLGPLLLSVPVFFCLRKLLPNKGATSLASGFGRAYLLVFCIPFALFMLFKGYADLLAGPEFPLRPAEIYLGVGLAAVPVLFLLLRSLARQAKNAPNPCRSVAIATYFAIPLFPIPAWLFSHLCYAGQQAAARWPDSAMQSLADYSLALADPLWKPLLTALVAAGVLKLCAGRVISGTHGRLAKTIVFLCAASVYIITGCRLFLGGYMSLV